MRASGSWSPVGSQDQEVDGCDGCWPESVVLTVAVLTASSCGTSGTGGAEETPTMLIGGIRIKSSR